MELGSSVIFRSWEGRKGGGTGAGAEVVTCQVDAWIAISRDLGRERCLIFVRENGRKHEVLEIYNLIILK
jgi:hypothetical protein